MLNCKSLLLLLLLSFYLNDSQSQGNIGGEISTDRLTKLLEELSGEKKFPILLELAEKTCRTNPDLAATYMEQAEEWIDENKINIRLFKYYKSLAAVKLAQDQYQESILLAEKARQLDLKNINAVDSIEIYKIIGNANSKLGKNDKAQQAFFKGLKVADSLHLENKVLEFTNAIGVVYLSLHDFKMAEKYFLLAIEKANEIGDEMKYSMSRENLSIVYMRLEKLKEAEKIILDQIDKHKAKGSKYYLGINYNNLTIIYQKQKKYEESIEYMKKALRIAEEINDPSDIAMRNCNLGQLYSDVNNYELAKKHLDIGLELSKSIENKEIYNNGLLQAAEMFEKFGKHENALDYFTQYSSLKDTMLNEKRIQVVAEMEEKYEAAKKELEILSLSGKNIEGNYWIHIFYQAKP